MADKIINPIDINPIDIKPISFDITKPISLDNYIIPDGYEIKEIEETVDVRLARIEFLENELSEMSEPTDAELIEEGKTTSAYYSILRELEMLRDN